MTLKEKMTRVWNQKGCACPSHLCQWNTKGLGWQYGISIFLGYVEYLWVTPGRQTFKKYFHRTRHDINMENKRRRDWRWKRPPKHKWR